MVFVIINIIHLYDDIEILMISPNNTGISTDSKFLSIALDSSILAKRFEGFNLTDLKLQKLVKALAPAYFRSGGTMADCLTFSENSSIKSFDDFHNSFSLLDGGRCSFEPLFCYYKPQRPNFTMNAEEWLSLNEFAQTVGMSLLFDLNSLKRMSNGSWDYKNAEELIEFTAKHNLSVNWELGNEPDAYRRQFNYEVTASQLSEDFRVLRNILRKFPQFFDSVLAGPDTTRPRPDHQNSEKYLETFLEQGGTTVDAVTWHQYYFDGRTAVLADFVNPENFDKLQWEISQVKDALHFANISTKPLWLGETSSAYGGGARGLSDRYIASLIWLDKLGLGAKMGLKVVIRQSIFQGYYALLDENYNPSPDWWTNVLYKKLVGERVVGCELSAHGSHIRLYCHCTKNNYGFSSNTTSITIFGLNLYEYNVKIRIETLFPDVEIAGKDIYVYELCTDNVLSRDMFLNGKLLSLTSTYDIPELEPKIMSLQNYLIIPPYCMVFWVVPTDKIMPCCN